MSARNYGRFGSHCPFSSGNLMEIKQYCDLNDRRFRKYSEKTALSTTCSMRTSLGRNLVFGAKKQANLHCLFLLILFPVLLICGGSYENKF
jgi:hypothetical protein